MCMSYDTLTPPLHVPQIDAIPIILLFELNSSPSAAEIGPTLNKFHF